MKINIKENLHHHSSNYNCNLVEDTNTSLSDQACSDFALNFLFKQPTDQPTKTLDIFGECVDHLTLDEGLINNAELVELTLDEELDDSISLASSSQSPSLPSTNDKKTYDVQKKDSSSSSLQTPTKRELQPKIEAYLVPPESKEELVYGIHRIFQKTNLSLKEIQKGYAEKFQVSLKDIQKIYKSVCKRHPAAKKTSRIKVLSRSEHSRSDRVLRSTAKQKIPPNSRVL